MKASIRRLARLFGLLTLIIGATAGEIAPRARGSLPLAGPITALEISGSHAFAAASDRGVVAVDLSAPASPRIVGEVNTPGAAIELALSGNFLYVADADAGLQIIDASDPTALRIVGSLPAPDATDIAAAGAAVYLVSGSILAVIDVTDPTRPLVRDTHTFSGELRIASNGRILGAVGTGPTIGTSAVLYDLTDPFHPWAISTIERTGGRTGFDTFMDIEVLGNSVYLTSQLYESCCEGWVYPAGTDSEVYDISDPRAPAYRQEGGGGLDVFASGNYFFGAGESGFSIFENTLRGEFFKRSFVSSARMTGGAVAYADHLFVASDNQLLIYELALANPRSSSTTLDDQGISDVVSNGPYAFAAARAGLKVLDVRNPFAPELISELPLPAPHSILLRGNFVYLAGVSGLHTVDISNPRNPRVTSHNTTPLQRIYFIGERIYSCNPPNSGYVCGFDLADPSAPELRWPRIFGDWQPTMLGVSRQYVFMGTGGGVRVIDTTTHSSPGMVAGFNVAPTHFKENRAYRTDGSFQIYDISNVLQPRLLGSAPAPPFGEINVVGEFAYISTSGSLTICDISDEGAPRIVASNNSLAAIRATFDGRRLHIASNFDGYSILEPHPQIWLRAENPFKVILEGPDGLSGQVQRSTDFLQWHDWRPITFSGENSAVFDDDPTAGARFFRFSSAAPP